MALSNFFWDTNVTAMPDDTLIPDGPQAWRYLIANIPALFGSEHHTFPTGSNIGAWHLPGSANIFVETTAPTARVDSQPFDSTDIGRLWYDTTLGIFKILTEVDTDVWTALPSLTAANNYTGNLTFTTDKFTIDAATGDTTIAGTLDVAGAAEVTGIATLGDGSVTKTDAAPTTDTMLTNKKYVDDKTDFSAVVSRVKDTNYTADSAGFLVVKCKVTAATNQDRFVQALSDANVTPTTEVGRYGVKDGGNGFLNTSEFEGLITVPILKGLNYRVTDTGGAWVVSIAFHSFGL